MLEVKIGTEGFSTSGNEGSDENGVSRSIEDNEDSSQVSISNIHTIQNGM